MYSLGIILFEMFASGRVYSTGMERVQRLRSLRQPVPEFPPAWPSELVKERQVIEWLVTHKAEDRPSPLELLQSDLLPPRLEDESVQETLRLVTDHSSVYHLQLLDALFAPQPPADEEIRDVTFDAGSQQQIRSKSGDSREHLVDPRESVVVEFLRTVFLRHGAVELQAPLLMPPRSGLYSSVKEGPSGNTPVQLLDSTGQVVFLPRDHLIPFARIIARSENHRLKRFCIGPVYRDSLLAGGQPLSILAANMDIIVGAGGNLPSAAEGECLACLEEILGEVPGFKDDWVVLINHGTILNLLLEVRPPC
jgi:translation initiation factor 2-alpha kinase 4